jgi:hypothetical protein
MRDWPHSLCFSRKELGIHCSGPNLDSGIFRVAQYRSSTRASNREKTGMTMFMAVYKERRNGLIQAFFTPPFFFFVYNAATCCAESASSSGQSPGRCTDALHPKKHLFEIFHKNKKSFLTW